MTTDPAAATAAHRFYHAIFSGYGSLDLTAAAQKPEMDRYGVMGECFAFAMDHLRQQSDSREVAAMAAAAWDVVHYRYAAVVGGMELESLGVIAIGDQGAAIGLPRTIGIAALVPPKWLDLIADNAVMQMGAMVFAASQLADLYAGRTGAGTVSRAYGYEAEFLLAVRRRFPAMPLTRYQEKLLRELPHGLASDVYKPFRQPVPAVAPR